MKPSIGRIVHYVLESGPDKGDHRPAVIVRTWGDTEQALVQLQVFTDSDSEQRFNDQLPPVMWRTSVVQDNDEKKPGTWHESERM